MKFKSYTGITWSNVELSGLLEDEDCHVCFERLKKHIGLHPFHMNNLRLAINEILSSNLNSYDSELNGFLLAYKNPKLLTTLGEILYDACFIHVDIEADFYIFRPQAGYIVKGIVNKKGPNHVGVLVHKAFNVSIPKPDNAEDWPGNDVEIGQEIRFTITHLDFTSRLPFIRGLIDPENYLQGCRLHFVENNNVPEGEEEITELNHQDTNGYIYDETIDESEHKKHKKKRKQMENGESKKKKLKKS